MKTENTEQQRLDLRKHLEKLVETTKTIVAIMEEVPHQNGTAQRSLKDKSGEYISHTKNGFMGTYRSENGQLYRLEINKI